MTLPDPCRGGPAGVLFRDDWSSLGHWAIVQGEFRVHANRLVAQSADAVVAVLKGRRFGDFVLDVDLLRPRRGYVGVALRRQSEAKPWSDGYHLCSLRPRHFRIIAKRGGQYDAPLFDSSRVAQLEADSVVRLRVWVRGDHLRVWIGEALVANVRDERPLPPGGIGLHVGSNGTDPRAEFANVVVRSVDAVPPPAADETPPSGLAEIVEEGEAAIGEPARTIRKRLSAAQGPALSDADLQDRASQVHALLWRYYYEPRTHMVYTIIESHTGQPILPTVEEVQRGLPNMNGWSTPIEDCAGYGNGKHLAWLVERYEVTRRPEHAAEPRRLLAGALHLGEIPPADETGFAEVVRGVLPDNKTRYAGLHRGSSGDNYNGYSYGLWRCFHSPIASPSEKARIAKVMARTCYPGSSIFGAMTGHVTQDLRWQQAYRSRAPRTLQSMASWTVESRLEAASWTAVQIQARLAALRVIDTDPLHRRACDLAMRANAWSRWKDVLAGLEYDETIDAYLHRVDTVRNPLDGMLTVMLTGNREVIDAFTPAFRRVVARYDFRDFRDQRQLTPFLGAYWLGVRHGAFHHDPKRPEPSPASLNPLDPSRDLVLTYFPNCNARANRVEWSGPNVPDAPNWRAHLKSADIDAVGEAIRVRTKSGGEATFRAISAPWVRDVSSERGHATEFRVRVLAGELAVRFSDDAFCGSVVLTPNEARLAGAQGNAAPTDDQWHEWRIEAKRGAVKAYVDGVLAIRGQLAAGGENRRLSWGTDRAREPSCFLCTRFCFETRDRFRYPPSSRQTP